MKSIFEQNGGTYTTIGDYSLPNLTVPDEPETHLSRDLRWLGCLKKYQRVLYINLLTFGKLSEHLREIDTAAYERHETIVQQMMKEQSVT